MPARPHEGLLWDIAFIFGETPKQKKKKNNRFHLSPFSFWLCLKKNQIRSIKFWGMS
jgi:hypothetical protein